MRPGRRPIPVPKKAEELLRRMTVREASKELGICAVTVRKWRRDLGIPGSWVVSRKKGERLKTSVRMASAVVRYQSMEKAARALGTSRQLIHKTARRYLKLVWAWR